MKNLIRTILLYIPVLCSSSLAFGTCPDDAYQQKQEDILEAEREKKIQEDEERRQEIEIQRRKQEIEQNERDKKEKESELHRKDEEGLQDKNESILLT